VHHLDGRAGTACPIAATAGQLTLALDDGGPVVHAPLVAWPAVVDLDGSVRLAPCLGREPARAPPAPIA
jgi:hypothetical protein